MAKGSKPRTWVGTFRVHFGPLTAAGRLMPIQRSDDAIKEEVFGGQIKSCTPDGKPVEQMYRDPEGNLYRPGELGRALVDDQGVYTLLDKEALAEAKKSDLPNNILNLTIHPAKDVESSIYPSVNKAYIFQPIIKVNRQIIEDPINDTWYNLLLEIVKNPKYKLLAMGSIHGHEGIYVLSTYNNYIAVQKYCYPDMLWDEYPIYRGTVDKASKTQAKALAEGLAEPFAPEEYMNNALVRVKDVIDGEYTPTSDGKTQAKAPASVDVGSIIENFLKA